MSTATPSVPSGPMLAVNPEADAERRRGLRRMRAVAGGLEPFRSVASRQPRDAEAGAEALLGMRPVA